MSPNLGGGFLTTRTMVVKQKMNDSHLNNR
jgi:hypothetical protein